jgi:Phosphotransferase enzyme family
MPRRGIYDEMHEVLRTAAAQLGIPADGARLVRLHSNASFVLPAAGLVIRIATSPDALDRAAVSIAVTRWLAGQGFPCVVPADIAGQPLMVHGHVVSAWRYVPTTETPGPAGAEIGNLLRDLHSRGNPPVSLQRLDDPFASVATALDDTPAVMPETDRSWLRDRITTLQDQWSGMDFALPQGLIHGDAHPGNLIRAASGHLILADWDHVTAGPREWDLIQIHYLHRRFRHGTGDDIGAFAAAYGWDIRTWPGLGTLIAIREITGLSPYIRTAPTKPFSREQLTHRLRTLRSGDTTARWDTPPPTV